MFIAFLRINTIDIQQIYIFEHFLTKLKVKLKLISNGNP